MIVGQINAEALAAVMAWTLVLTGLNTVLLVMLCVVQWWTRPK